jgi:hypothetical protein
MFNALWRDLSVTDESESFRNHRDQARRRDPEEAVRSRELAVALARALEKAKEPISSPAS